MTMVRFVKGSAVAAVVLLVTACGGEEATTSAQPGASATATTAAVPSPTPSAADAERVENKDKTFSVTVPATWEQVDSPKSAVPRTRIELALAEPVAAATGFRTNINVTTQAAVAGLPLDAYATQTLAAAKKQGFTVAGDVEKTDLAGKPARGYGWTYQAQGVEVAQVQLVTIDDSRVYTVTLSTLESEFDQAGPFYKDVLASWQWR